jgi:hypothetical protein
LSAEQISKAERLAETFRPAEAVAVP